MNVDPDVVRAAHRQFPTGVTVVTAMTDDGPRGLTVNAFSSVSMDPPTVLVCVSRTSRSIDALLRAKVIGINLLSSGQEALARTFASSTDDRFSGVAWSPGESGAPLLDGTSAHFEVEPETIALASTHVVFVGRVVSCSSSSDLPPLLYVAGGFREL